MSAKTKKVQWQVMASLEGKQWPMLVETDLPSASAKQFREAMAGVSNWFLKCNIYPWLGKVPLTEVAPDPDAKPMKEHVAIRPPPGPPCPTCEKKMISSKHQDQAGKGLYYCGQRAEDGSYCLWRGIIEMDTGATKTWKVKP